MRSRRTAAVVLLSFSSGLPLGLVWFAIPDWMRDIGVDIRVVGLITLAQAPWTFKVLWSPLMDRYVPPFWGRRRGWMAVTQIALVRARPDARRRRRAARSRSGWSARWRWRSRSRRRRRTSPSTPTRSRCCGRTSRARPSARGPRSIAPRMLVSGGVAITLAARIGWPAVNVLLALLYIPMLADHLEVAGARGADRAAAHAARGRLAAVPRASSRGRARSRSSRSSSSTSSPTSSRRR